MQPELALVVDEGSEQWRPLRPRDQLVGWERLGERQLKRWAHVELRQWRRAAERTTVEEKDWAEGWVTDREAGGGGGGWGGGG